MTSFTDSTSSNGCVISSHARRLAAALVFIASLFIGDPAASAAEAPPQTCVLLEKEGKVEVARKGSAVWNAAQVNDTLQIGDRLRTGLRSRATLRWSELAVVRVDQLTSMEIQPPARPTDKPELDLKSGATYFFSRERPTDVQFRTPVASGAIRGTEFNLAVAEDGRTTLSLLDGEVELANAQGASTIKSGEQGTVEKDRAPTKTALIDAVNVIQWALYYPAVIVPDDLGLSEQEKQTLKESLDAYQQGDLLKALGSYPENRTPGSDAERGLHAALLLSAGRVDEVEALTKDLPANSSMANALKELIAAVKNRDLGILARPSTGSEFLARSYYLQSRGQLAEALEAARDATRKAPGFGATWIRAAELEFGFGRTDDAIAALNKGLALSPRNAQGLALNGFLHAARNDTAAAMDYFNQAIAIDGALANAWLGRGLVKIRRSLELLGGVTTLPATAAQEARDDLQVAATLEPQRAVLRSYLGKAFNEVYDLDHARKELELARKLDPNDPTGWLYLALLNQQENRINEAVSDLEQSKALNENRSLFRSRLLLDKDQAVRGANLASIYQDAGMFDRSVQEASRAVEHDYANYSAHLFLANSYDALRDPKLINLRYEAPWFSQLLVANLLAPVGGGTLSQNISQQEYSRLFASDQLGIFSSTEYFSSGDWVQSGSQYGVLGNTSYSLDAYYRTENGQRSNNDLEQLNLAARFKQQITDKDSLFFQISYFDAESGDVAQYYDQDSASKTLRVTETQEPNLLLGYHREWSPGSHTLFLVGRFDDTLTLEDSNPALLWLRTAVSPFSGATNISIQNPAFFSLDYESELTAYSLEAQQIWQAHPFTTIVGGRFQTGESDTRDDLVRQPPLGSATQIHLDTDTDLQRYSIYLYEHWQALDSLRVSAGISYDRLDYPANIDTSPITDDEDSTDRFSPKAGIVWSPWQDGNFRAVYTRSLGGVFFDTSVRLEPTEVAGFNQAFRSLIPESVVGLVPATKFETWGAGFDQSFKTRTYLHLQGEFLNSDATRTVGILTNSDTTIPVADSPSSRRQSLDYEERSFVATVNQLVWSELALGARYKMTEAELDSQFKGIPANTSGLSAINQDVEATLHQVWLYAIYQHRCGGFAQFDTVWSQQSNRDYSPDIPGDDFWQFNVYAGYRFLQRRAEVRVGLLNITDEDYKLNPLTLYNELPRERTLTVSLKLDF